MNCNRSRKVLLEPSRRSSAVIEFDRELRRRVIGQDEAVASITTAYQSVLAGMTLQDRPIANLLFLGPTGSGKTRVVEAAAEILFGSPKAMLKIDCAEYQHGHEVAKLIGAPPGYLGHGETKPLLTQEAINQYQTDKLKMTFVLFDEIEKANDALWRLLLGILDKATLTLGDNRRVDFSNAVVILTSNLGGSEISRLLSGGLGFAPAAAPVESNLDRKLYQVALEAAKARFSPEFMNRLDRTIVFETLSERQLGEILDLELRAVQKRLLSARREQFFVLHCEARAKHFLLKEGTDPKYGARPLKRAIDRHLVQPLTCLMSSGQIDLGDIVTADISADGSCLVFTKEDPGDGMDAPFFVRELPMASVSAGV